MHKTTITKNTLGNSITVSTETLMRLLDCGRGTAVRIGEAADAKIVVGRRVLWNSEKVKSYLNRANLHLI